MPAKKITQVIPPHPFEAYSHVVSPIPAIDGGGFLFTMPDLPGVVADGASAHEAIDDGLEAFLSTISAMVDRGQEIPSPASASLSLMPKARALSNGCNDDISIPQQAKPIRLNPVDQETFLSALLSPPPASPALKQAFARRATAIGGS